MNNKLIGRKVKVVVPDYYDREVLLRCPILSVHKLGVIIQDKETGYNTLFFYWHEVRYLNNREVKPPC